MTKLGQPDKNGIIHGLLNLREERELAVASFGYIKRDIGDIKNRYIGLGFHLHEMQSMRYYEDFGYIDFYEFCEKNFKMDKSAVSRCIDVWWEFCAVDENSCSRKAWLSPQYSGYNYSQLCELLPLDKKQRKKITPDMTVKQIREKKKEWREEKKAEAREPVATSQQEKYTEEHEYNEMQLPCDECGYDINGCCDYPVTSDDYCVMGDKKILVQESEEMHQKAFPVMKNMQEREDFVNSYKDWNIWCRNEKTEDVFYRYDLPDGAAIVVRNYPMYIEWTEEEHERDELFLLTPGYKHFMNCKSSMAVIKNYLKDMKNK